MTIAWCVAMAMLASVAMGTCPKYNCSTQIGENRCALKVEEDNMWLLNPCNETEQICDVHNMTAEGVAKCSSHFTGTNLFPGEYCSGNKECISNHCEGDEGHRTCKGVEKGNACSDHADCNPGLYCDATCKEGKKEDEDCDSVELCKTGLVCNNGKCVKLGSVEDGEIVSNTMACKSFYAWDDWKCTKGPEFIGPKKGEHNETDYSCPETGLCLYKLKDEVLTRRCTCGYTGEGKEYCNKHYGDVDVGDYIEYSRTEELAQKCHILKGPICENQKFDEMKEGFYRAFIVHEQMLRSSIYEDNPDCVRKTVNAKYWKAVEKVTPIPQQPRTAILIFLIIVMVLAGAIALTMLVVYYLSGKKKEESLNDF